MKSQKIIWLTIDSFDYNYIKKANNFSRLMPFLYNFKNKCLYANNLFSEGPYTEAGIKSLLTGKNTLENNGYFLRLGNEKSNVFEYFKDAGYQINASFMADDMYSNSIISKMDHFYFTSSMHFSTFWNRRFELYSEIIKVRDLTRQELVDLMELVELIFYSYELFLDKGLDERHDMIKKQTQNFNFEKNIRIILNEKDKYESSKDNYIINLLKENSNHILFSLDEIHNDDFLNKKTIDNVIYKKNIKTIKLLNKKQTKLNIINKSIKYSKLLHLNYKSSYNYLYNSYFLINSCKKIYGYNNINDFTKYMPSFDYQMNYMIDNVLNDDDSKQFMYLHVEDMHHPNTFFSYESKNEDDLQEEIDRCNAILTSTPNNYKGLLSYDLSLGYTDLVLERLFRKLKNKKCFEETTLIITADHGSSFHMSPLRESLVNNFHIENYNIPLFIFNNNIVNEQLNGLYSNIDVLPTVLDIIDCPNNLYEMDGKSILNFEGRDYAFVEYEGPGCPNMVENKIWYALRSKKYLIGCKVGYKESVNVNSILEIYDLERDFTEEHNLVKDLITEDEILKMIRIIADRHENIKSKIKARYE